MSNEKEQYNENKSTICRLAYIAGLVWSITIVLMLGASVYMVTMLTSGMTLVCAFIGLAGISTLSGFVMYTAYRYVVVEREGHKQTFKELSITDRIALIGLQTGIMAAGVFLIINISFMFITGNWGDIAWQHVYGTPLFAVSILLFGMLSHLMIVKGSPYRLNV